MKAQKVFENINFERNKDPKKSMEIGENAIKREIVKKIMKFPTESLNYRGIKHEYWPRNYQHMYAMDNYMWVENWLMNEKLDILKQMLEDIVERSIHFKENQDIVNSLNEYQNFERGTDPKHAMSIGKKSLIEEWLKSMNVSRYEILLDFTINLYQPFVKQGQNFGGELPEFIQFNKIEGYFDVDDCGFETMRGFPIEVTDYFSIQMNDLTSLEFSPKIVGGPYYCNTNPGNFMTNQVEAVCKVGGDIQADDSIDR